MDTNRTLKLYNPTQIEDVEKCASLGNGQDDTSEFLSSLINNTTSTPTAILTNKYEVLIAGAEVPNSEIEIKTETQTKLKSEDQIIITTRDLVEAKTKDSIKKQSEAQSEDLMEAKTEDNLHKVELQEAQESN